MAENINEKYIPGTCNIGNEAFEQRKKTLAFFFIITVVCVIFMQLSHLNHLYRLFILIPASTTAICVLQVYYHFCVRFGIWGVFNFGKVDEATTTKNKEYLRKDRAKALKMCFAGIVVGTIVAVIYYLLPV